MKKFVGKIKPIKSLQSTKRLYNESNTKFLEEIEEKWEKDPKSVDPSWNEYFSNLQNDTYQNRSLPSLKIDGSMPLELKTSIQAFVNSHQIKGHNIAGNF